MAKWVYTWKTDEFGRVVRVKARFVARGFAQRDGVDFFETISSCPSVTSIRLLAALACELGLGLCHLDVEQAFVRSELNEVMSAAGLRRAFRYGCQTRSKPLRLEAGIVHVTPSFCAGYELF